MKTSSSKVSATLCMAVFFFLFFLLSSTYAGRLGPASSLLTPDKTLQEVSEMEKANMEESCEDIGEEECLKRRTLAAHLDYIYTQKHKP